MKKITFILLFALLILSPLSLLAHGYLARTEPADGAVLPTSPPMIKVWFNEAIQANSGRLSVINGKGEPVELHNVRQDAADTTLLLGDLPPSLPDGAYIVTASGVVVSDGHEPTGSFVFWVGEKKQAAASDKGSPAYAMVGLFIAVLGLAGGASFWLNRRPYDLDLIRPEDESDHFGLK